MFWEHPLLVLNNLHDSLLEHQESRCCSVHLQPNELSQHHVSFHHNHGLTNMLFKLILPVELMLLLCDLLSSPLQILTSFSHNKQKISSSKNKYLRTGLLRIILKSPLKVVNFIIITNLVTMTDEQWVEMYR